MENEDGDLSLSLQCRSDLTGTLKASANADIEAMQARGQISLTDINVRPLLYHVALPGGLTTEDTQATVNVDFTVDGPETMNGRFDLQFPSLTVMRRDLKLDLDTVAVSGAIDVCRQEPVRVHRYPEVLASRHWIFLPPPASGPMDASGKSVIEVHAAASRLDVAVAGAVTRAIAGDLNAIRNAFSVAREGQLTDATYFAGFDIDETGWHLNQDESVGPPVPGVGDHPGHRCRP